MPGYKTVPNQRTITLHKEPADKLHPFSINNLVALDEAVGRLKSLAGFKLWMYFAKLNDKDKAGNRVSWALSSAHFCEWAGVTIKAYNTAWAELVEEGYLVPVPGTSTLYDFYEKSQKH